MSVASFYAINCLTKSDIFSAKDKLSLRYFRKVSVQFYCHTFNCDQLLLMIYMLVIHLFKVQGSCQSS